MSKLKKCENCKTYTLKQNCTKCKKPTLEAHYKFLKVKDVKKQDFKN